MFSKNWVGKKVVFEDEKWHNVSSLYYPKVGTIGIVERYDECEDAIFVRWEKGSTSGDDRWWVLRGMEVSLLGEKEDELTDEEIFEMLRNKMEKNGLKRTSAYFSFGNHGEWITMYKEQDIQKAIAIAYRAGYVRGEKGRPFKYKNFKKS